MGANLEVESKIGKGSTFRLDIELKASGATSKHKPIATREIEDEQRPLIPPTPEEMAILFDLAMKGDLLRLKKRAAQIEQLDEKFRPFAQKLSQLVDKFDEDQILALITRNMDGR